MANNRRAQTRKTHASNSRKDFKPSEKRIKPLPQSKRPKYGKFSND